MMFPRRYAGVLVLDGERRDAAMGQLRRVYININIYVICTSESYKVRPVSHSERIVCLTVVDVCGPVYYIAGCGLIHPPQPTYAPDTAC